MDPRDERRRGDVPEMPGWTYIAMPFDHGTKWGVAITNNKEGDALRRHAVRVPAEAAATIDEAVAAGLPVLRAWASEPRQAA